MIPRRICRKLEKRGARIAVRGFLKLTILANLLDRNRSRSPHTSVSGMGLIASTIIIVVAALAIGIAFATFSSNQFSEYSKAESVKVSNANVWVDEKGESSGGSVVVHNNGDKEVRLDTLTVRGKQILYTNWYYSKIENKYEDPSNAKMIPANAPVNLRPGESATIYFVDDKTNITPLDVGSATTLSLLTSAISIPISPAPKSEVVFLDNSGPETSLTIGLPRFSSDGKTYVSSSTPFTLSANDPSGVRSTQYQIASAGSPISDSSWIDGSSFKLSGTDGSYTIYYRGIDMLGNIEIPKSLSVFLNNNGPITSLLIGAPQHSANESIYITSKTPLSLSAQSALGIKDSFYRSYLSGDVNRPAFSTGQSFTITGSDGTYVVDFYSIDNLGNVEPSRTQTLILDNTAPFTSSSLKEGSVLLAKSLISLTASDNFGGAGIAQDPSSGIYYSFDSQVEYTFVHSNFAAFFITDLAEGSHTLNFYSKDNLGNAEELQRINFTIPDCSGLPLSELRGVNFFDPILTKKHTGPLWNAKSGYLEYNLAAVKNNGFNFIRVPYFWEAYEVAPDQFLDEMDLISSITEQKGICVLFDFHHWRTSSYFLSGGAGFPWFLLEKYQFEGGRETAKLFWNDFYNNTLTFDGKSAWDLQIEFMKKIIDKVEKYNSVLGYEILNEPPIFDYSQYHKLGVYHRYMAEQLRLYTDKYIFFNADHPDGIKRSHQLAFLIAPSGVKDIVFAPHTYAVLNPGSGAEWQMLNWEKKAKAWGNIPIVVGEWAVEGKDAKSINIQQFNKFERGWAYWSWAPYELRKSYYQLIDQNYQPTENLLDLLELIDVYPEGN